MSFLTDKVRKALESNPNIESVTASNVKYTVEFIESALEQHDSGMSAREIWKSAGFELSFFKDGYCRKTIKRWKKKRETQGKKSFKKETRGRKKGRRFSSPQEEIAYLKAENAFLKELRALEENSRKK